MKTLTQQLQEQYNLNNEVEVSCAGFRAYFYYPEFSTSAEVFAARIIECAQDMANYGHEDYCKIATCREGDPEEECVCTCKDSHPTCWEDRISWTVIGQAKGNTRGLCQPAKKGDPSPTFPPVPLIPLVSRMTLDSREGWQSVYVGDYLDNIDAAEFIPCGSMVQVSGYRMASCVRRCEE